MLRPEVHLSLATEYAFCKGRRLADAGTRMHSVRLLQWNRKALHQLGDRCRIADQVGGAALGRVENLVGIDAELGIDRRREIFR